LLYFEGESYLYVNRHHLFPLSREVMQRRLCADFCDRTRGLLLYIAYMMLKQTLSSKTHRKDSSLMLKVAFHRDHQQDAWTHERGVP
jgi:hypothetical protein